MLTPALQVEFSGHNFIATMKGGIECPRTTGSAKAVSSIVRECSLLPQHRKNNT